MYQIQPISDAETKRLLVPKESLDIRFSDLEYSIFSNILKSTSDSLFEKETNLMAKSNNLIESLNSLQIIKKK